MILPDYLRAGEDAAGGRRLVFPTGGLTGPGQPVSGFPAAEKSETTCERSDRATPENWREHPWFPFLDKLKGNLVFYAQDEQELKREGLILASLNRSVTLVCDFDMQDDSFPPWVQVVELAPSERVVYDDPLLAACFPDLYACCNACACLLGLLAPAGVVVVGTTGYKGKVLCALAQEKEIPVIVLTGREVPDGIGTFLPDCRSVDTDRPGTEPEQPGGCGAAVHDGSALSQVCRRINAFAPVPYFSQAACPALHIGCGSFLLEGWWNVDINCDAGAHYMNAEWNFPFPDESFRYVFSEHLFEHLAYAGAKNMLREAYRVLRPGGIFRLAMPHLEFLTGLYANREQEAGKRYVDWSLTHFAPEMKADFEGEELPCMFVVNNFMRLWGHRLIYDRQTITRMLEKTGFTRIVYPEIGVSEHPDLAGLENHGNAIPGWANAMETLVIEARK